MISLPAPGLKINGPSGPDTIILGNPLGIGAFGVVYDGSDTTSGIRYTIKFPHTAAFSSEKQMLAFQNEVNAAATIVHPNVIRVLFVSDPTSDGPHYLVMEYINGGTLYSLLKTLKREGSQLPPETVIVLSQQLVDGLSVINKAMLHRDIKPDNILMDGNTPKIKDFGLSKVVGALTRSRTFKGGQQVLYMAPEAWRYETNNIQIDMYALGIVLYQIATLEYPYQIPAVDDIEAFRNMHFFETALPISKNREDLPPEFEHIVARLLAKRASDRYADWSEALDTLAKLGISGDPVNGGRQNEIDSLLKQVVKLHAKRQEEWLQVEQDESAARERNKLDRFQMGKLLKQLENWADEFNARSSLGSIALESTRGEDSPFPSYLLMLPLESQIAIVFFWIDPPLNLRSGSVRFAAYVSDVQGGGFNLLLIRGNDQDMYGEWAVCKVSVSALARQDRAPSKKQPFGFSNAEDIREIERADRAMHVFENDFSDDVLEAFSLIAQEALEQ